MATLMAFGTRNRLAWVPCPQSPFEGTVARRTSQNEMRSGALAVSTAPMPRKTFNLNWIDTAEAIDPVLQMATENDGPPYYFLHPDLVSNVKNALPAHWAAPAYAAAGRPGMFTDTYALVNQGSGFVDDTLISLATTLSGSPKQAVRIHVYRADSPIAFQHSATGGTAPYINVGGTYKATDPSATVIIPPGLGFRVRATGAVANGASIGVVLRSADATGRFSSGLASPSSYITPSLGGTAATYASDTVWRTLDLVVCKAVDATSDSYVDLAGLEVYVGAPSVPFSWLPGKGQMPLGPNGNDGLSHSIYSVVGQKLVSVQWPLTERFIAW